MAQPRERNFVPSPHSSSGGTESLQGTPDTRVTTFSPEDDAGQPTKHMIMFGNLMSKLSPLRLSNDCTRSDGSAGTNDKDPFVTPAHAMGTVLSPTASTFNPYTTSTHSSAFPGGFTPAEGTTRHLRISSHGGISSTEVENWLKKCTVSTSPPSRVKFSVVDENDDVIIHFPNGKEACAAYSLLVTKRNWHVEFVESVFTNREQPQVRELADANTERLAQDGTKITATLPEMVAFKRVVAHAIAQPGTFATTERIMGVMHAFLTSHGQIVSFSPQNTHPGMPHMAVVEFSDPKATWNVLANYAGGVLIEGIQLLVSSLQEGVFPFTNMSPTLQTSHSVPGTLEEASRFRDEQASRMALYYQGAAVQFPQPFWYVPMTLQPPCGATPTCVPDQSVSPSHSTMNAVAAVSPLSPSYPVVGSAYRTPPSPALTSHQGASPSRAFTNYGRSDHRRNSATRVAKSYHGATGHHNHVEIARIRDGIDVRTTIMLRNIPNKVDQAMLKRIVDESSWGKYDFMYLRIDFANDCNVGYAFINFVDPLDIIDFVEARGNQRWNCFKSDKVAEISYATIQGKDCLVQKFRNSSVMLEAPHYRPKLYFTSNGPMPEHAGQEEMFPEPDNQSKMKRSCENAEHVGLFTPNASQHFRDEQRRRRSQYDRGTRLAALEEYD